MNLYIQNLLSSFASVRWFWAIPAFFGKEIHYSGLAQELCAMFCLGGDDVLITFPINSCFAIDGQLHFSFYHDSPLSIIVEMLWYLCRLLHFEENQLMLLSLQYPGSYTSNIDVRYWQSCYDFRISFCLFVL